MATLGQMAWMDNQDNQEDKGTAVLLGVMVREVQTDQMD